MKTLFKDKFGAVREYTQLVTFEELRDGQIEDAALYEDAQYLGEGVFSHWEIF